MVRRTNARLGLLIGVGLVLGAGAPQAHTQVPGAAYSGTPATGGTIRFKLADDGTRVNSYTARDVTGDTCTFLATGDEGVWPGAAITARAFEYRADDAILELVA